MNHEGSGVAIARARPDQVPAVVAVHLESFPGFFLSFLGPRFLRVFYDGLASDADAILLVAEQGGAVVGFVGGAVDEARFFAHLKQRRRNDFIRASLGAVARRPSVARRLWRARSRDQEETLPGVTACLLTLGVSPTCQGQHIGSHLVAAFERELAERGTDTYYLTTDALDNQATIAFYERRGLHVASDYVTPEGRQMLVFQGATGPAREAQAQ